MNTENQQDRIDDYLRGRASDPAAFERELQENPQLTEDMNATRLALDALHVAEDAHLKDRLRRLEVGLATAPAPSARVVPLHPRPRRQWLNYAAAAALLLFVAGYFMLRPVPTDNALAALDGVEPFPNLSYVITKGGSGTAPNRAAAYTAYESGNYPEAEAAFYALGDEDPVDRFYLAQSLLAQDKYGPARDLFRELATATDFNLTQESAYYEAVAQLGLGDRAGATGTLAGIAAQNDHPMQAEAATLLAELD